MNKKSIVDVSVYMLTYFHEKYIAKAIESVLAQNTKYKFEIVICDDCSTDRTKVIVEAYRQKYPKIIRAYYAEKNIGIPRNIYKARCLCRGKYIVSLSGDDYWICDEKIEKQVNFLEENTNFIGVGNAMELRYDDDNYPFDILPKKNERNKIFTIKDYENGDIFYSHGFMMRNLFLLDEYKTYFRKAQDISSIVDDAVDNVLILKKGDIYVMDLVTDVYRVPRKKEQKNNYNSRYTRLQKTKNSIDIFNNLNIVFSDTLNLEKKYINIMPNLVCSAVLDINYTNYRVLYKSIPLKYRKPFYKGVLVKSVPTIFKFIIDRMAIELNKIVKYR